MVAKDGQLSIRKLKYTDYDFSLLYKWLNDEQVQSYYEGKSVKNTREQIHEKFGRRALGEDEVIPCIIEFDCRPIGYLQYYPLEMDEIHDYGAKEDQPQYGIDLFIGELEYWNQGIGTKTIKVIIKFLFEEQEVQDIYIDPLTWNARAIRCYEKCGFKKVKVLPKRELHDGEYKDNQIMKLSKDEFQGSERNC
ncbi:GNAT family N-acetyltransferase [Alkalihalobacillus sp. AL-G]|uniref:GNAT family N-acetyltransferase n=1 Tax=Alkalihalobacillus sp. AL-G TaxID=2926399 RepID=UPI00272B3CCF|nr:GNAT family N-acetyltransferase [Alkalihalobacillus sp. AL-G]WLD94615.1 acetyltransferase [Alkalihalobacillus sp. AL-G]